MNSQIQELCNQIQKKEIDSIYTYSSAILEPQSEIAAKIYSLYGNTISNDIHHNYHTASLPGTFNVETREIPSFKEFITSTLSKIGRDRYHQILINNREQFINLGIDAYETDHMRFCDNLLLICKTAENIAKHITSDSYCLADQELARLRERFSDFYPQYKEMFELKPSFFGLSIDISAIEKNISTFLKYKK